MPKQKSKSPLADVFQIGDKVRVRCGVRDQDYPDMPLGGWKGTVAEVHEDGIYTVEWSKETLSTIHPVFKQRCEIDGLEEDNYVLNGDDLELDTGSPLDIDHPKKITTKPLSPRVQDDRIRMVFGLTSNDLLPEVDNESLEAYHDCLSSNLVFSFTAQYRAEYGHPERVNVIGLGVMFLFWSHAASKSEWVDWEWRRGLRIKGIDFRLYAVFNARLTFLTTRQ